MAKARLYEFELQKREKENLWKLVKKLILDGASDQVVCSSTLSTC